LIFTGLRRTEAKLLRVGDIDLKHRCVRLRSETTKNRQAAQLPLHDDLITDLRAYLRGKDEPDAPQFAAIPRAQTARRDFEEAGIAIEDERGHRLDLHALRATFATRLLQSGVPVAKAAQLTRHKSVAILEKHYNKLGKLDAEDAMRALKPLRKAAPTAT